MGTPPCVSIPSPRRNAHKVIRNGEHHTDEAEAVKAPERAKNRTDHDGQKWIVKIARK